MVVIEEESIAILWILFVCPKVFLEINIYRYYIFNEVRGEMKRKEWFGLLALWLIMIFFIAPLGRTQPLFPYEGEGQFKPGTKAPIITHSFAVEKGYYGYIWKIYIEVEDPDDDMFKIASVVDQVGYGYYPTDWIILKSQFQKHLKGYIQWNTFSSRTARLKEWTQITLKISIIDKAGNESNVVVFPFTFESGVKDQYKYKLPAPFNEGDISRLGYIHIDLFEPTEMGGAGPGFK